MLEPPRFITRYIRRKAKAKASATTPLFLGALTVLIPCGVTQAMMGVAVGTGSAVGGAVIMFTFILGTSPVFFAIAYAATRLGTRLEVSFMRVVAVTVLVLGLISIDSGLTMAGFAYSFTNLRLAASGGGDAVAQTALNATSASASKVYGQDDLLGPPSLAGKTAASQAGASGQAGDGSLTINVFESGYQPKVAHARANQPLRLSMVTNKTYSCAQAVIIPALGIQKVLPISGITQIDVPSQQPGTKLYYSCPMGMYSRVIVFDA